MPVFAGKHGEDLGLALVLGFSSQNCGEVWSLDKALSSGSTGPLNQATKVMTSQQSKLYQV